MTQQLIDACIKNDVEAAKILIQNAVNLDHQDVKGMTALMHAIAQNSVLTALLINNGANVNLQDKNGLTALMHLPCPSHQAELLIVNGADIYERRISLAVPDQEGTARRC